MITHFIDVSHWQGVIDWKLVKQDPRNFKLVIIKATESTNFTDSRLYTNLDGAKREEFNTGVYHFWRASTGGKAQADHLTNKTGMWDIPYIVDVEDDFNLPAGSTYEKLVAGARNVKEMVYTLANKTGVKPIIYTANWFWSRFPASEVAWAKDFHLWVANYKDYSLLNPLLTKPWINWLMWQYSAKGIVNGIKASVDLNIVRTEDLNKLFLKPVVTTPEIIVVEKIVEVIKEVPFIPKDVKDKVVELNLLQNQIQAKLSEINILMK
jgi:lysozyme